MPRYREGIGSEVGRVKTRYKFPFAIAHNVVHSGSGSTPLRNDWEEVAAEFTGQKKGVKRKDRDDLYVPGDPGGGGEVLKVGLIFG